MNAVLSHSETVVIGNKDPDFQGVPKRLNDDQCARQFSTSRFQLQEDEHATSLAGGYP
jgi:hypothetical protein